MKEKAGGTVDYRNEGESSRQGARLGDTKDAIVLVVEDEPGIRQLTKTILRKHVKEVLLAENGQVAVDLCQEHPEITIVLMDIKMPVMSGLDATRIIKSFRKDLPIIFVTAYALAEDRASAMNAGCDDFLVKPFKALDLLQMVSEYGI
jgi:two-component system, cell cycle response regulator DivK